MNQIAQRLVFYGLPTVAIGAAWARRLAYDKLGERKSCPSAAPESWLNTDHAQAITALKIGERTKAKKGAVRSNRAVYSYCKLEGVHLGKPLASLRKEPEKRATPPKNK